MFAVVIFGSVVSGSASKSSDLDLCVASSSHEPVERVLETLANSLEVHCLQGEGVCHVKALDKKLFAIIPGFADGTTILRMDCFVVEKFSQVGEFLSTSEIVCDPSRRQETILSSEDSDALRPQAEQLGPPKPSDLVNKLVVTFLQALKRQQP